MLESFIPALMLAFSPEVILYVAIGVFMGVTLGAIPGLSGDMAIAILLPIVFFLEPAAALGLLTGIYKGGMFGGSISAISFGVPGTPGSAATAIDGYQAKLKGTPNKALMTALYSSVIGDSTSDLVLIFLALPLAIVALTFGPVEFFALYAFSLLLISALTKGKVAKGVAMAALGVLLAMIGRDPMGGTLRLTFGIPELAGGLALIPVLVGIFAVSELIIQLSKAWMERAERIMDDTRQRAQSLLGDYDASKDKLTFSEFRFTLKATWIGTTMGTLIGALPGAGSSLAAFISYGLAQRFSRKGDEFGKGSLEGVAAAEAGNSATSGSTLIPLFAFGIPGSATAALFGAAFILMGMTPGPRLIYDHTEVIYALFLILIYANFINLFLSQFLLPFYSKIAMIQSRILLPIVCVLAILGTFAAGNSVIDVWVLLFAGFLGVVLRMFNFPLAPLILGFIVAPGAERALRQSLLIGRGDWMHLLSSPIAIGLYTVAAIMILTFTLVLRDKK
ncbi:tripartite tricarboxylate transporter permease [Natronohydrobacter thiooxidans]|jgi:putative tricarboxylic transport membrane protein|uniref:tripartite tricarboxylate transporter permease n=1 Tax=Natronohydrobacter thiooxidans TaxID=87172 RepID=UPI0008FF3FB2|nr:tripartite tricarboxylate transporter permease [Natronohydrobacter thiooxidans]